MKFQVLRCVMPVLLIGGAALAVRSAAQANLSIEAAQNGPRAVQWKVQSLVPAPGKPLFANYRVWVSTNLQNWGIASEIISGADFAGKTVLQEISTGTGSNLFCRVESLLDFSGIDFSGESMGKGFFALGTFAGCDFFAAQLQDADFRGANLRAADFRTAALNDSALRRADVMGADFSGASAQGADFREANASFADFTGADLSFANFSGADLRFTSLLDASFNFVQLQRTERDDHTRLPEKLDLVWNIVNQQSRGKIFTGDDLTVCDLEGADLRDCVFRNVDLRGSDFRDADLSGADFRTARMDFADLRQTTASNTLFTAKTQLIWELNNQDSSGRVLTNANLSNASLVSARLSGADLRNADLRLAVLIDADLSGANLRNAVLTQTILTGLNLENADLTGANFSQADLTDASLRGANVTGANFAGVIFFNTVMPNGTIRNR